MQGKDKGYFGLNNKTEKLISRLIIEYQKVGWEIADGRRGKEEYAKGSKVFIMVNYRMYL